MGRLLLGLGLTWTTWTTSVVFEQGMLLNESCSFCCFIWETPSWTWISAWAMKAWIVKGNAFLDLDFSLDYERDDFLDLDFSLGYVENTFLAGILLGL
ncbi:hypothetical protein RIR_jg41610.t1 [Rhizophagus irregularis DAOM 181602=DAOM 197198]|nr:hypothetical protein RIR_jg41610.t1 [Rhizophagus irregularis DAOM 181602=DAOM 197198]